MRRAGICGVNPANAGYASALTAHVPLKYAPLLDPRDALQLNLFEQPVKGRFFISPIDPGFHF